MGQRRKNYIHNWRHLKTVIFILMESFVLRLTFQSGKCIFVNVRDPITLQFQWIQLWQMTENVGWHFAELIVRQNQRIQIFHTCDVTWGDANRIKMNKLVRLSQLQWTWHRVTRHFENGAFEIIGLLIFLPSKSPSLMLRILFSWISSFLRLSKMDNDRCGTDVNSLPPRLRRFSFLSENNNVKNDIHSRFLFGVRHQTYFSKPRKASGSMTLILFSYKVRISNVSSPSNARLWICDMRLWFKLRISKWCKFLIAFDGAFCNWFCDTSSWVSPFPARRSKKENTQH